MSASNSPEHYPKPSDLTAELFDKLSDLRLAYAPELESILDGVVEHHGESIEDIARTFSFILGLGASQTLPREYQRWRETEEHITDIEGLEFHLAETLLLDKMVQLLPDPTERDPNLVPDLTSPWQSALMKLYREGMPHARNLLSVGLDTSLKTRLEGIVLLLVRHHSLPPGSENSQLRDPHSKPRAIILPFHNNVIWQLSRTRYAEYRQDHRATVLAALNGDDQTIPGLALGEYVRRDQELVAELIHDDW